MCMRYTSCANDRGWIGRRPILKGSEKLHCCGTIFYTATVSKFNRWGGRVVRAPDIQPRGRGFKARSDHLAELILGRPYFNSSVMLVNSHLVCLPHLGFLSLLCLVDIFASFSLSGILVN